MTLNNFHKFKSRSSGL